MRRRQTSPRAWFIVDRPADRAVLQTVGRLPQGTGVLVVGFDASPALQRIARARGLVMLAERNGTAARVHNVGDLRESLLRRTPLILLSPLYPTLSHPEWRPIQRMRAAALARLAGRRLIALGGMDARRFARVERLGFVGWAGIGAWVRT